MFLELVKKSRSYRKFDNSYQIPEETINDIIETVRFAPAGGNQQKLRYFVSADAETSHKIFKNTKWAALYKDWNGPTPSEEPTLFILICSKKEDEKIRNSMKINVGIAAQTIALAAAANDLGSCMIGSFNPENILKELNLTDKYNIELIVAIGKGDEKINMIDISEAESFNYYRDENGVHTVPKLTANDLIIK